MTCSISYQKVDVDGDLAGRQIDAFRVFMERNAQSLSSAGLTGIVVPSAFHANEGATGVRRLYFEEMATQSCYSFENRSKLFEIDSRFKFAPIVASRKGPTTTFPCAFYLQDDTWLFERNEQEPLIYSLEFIRRTGGEYLSLLELRSERDAEIARMCFANGELFGEVCKKHGVRFASELHMTNDTWRFEPSTSILSAKDDPRISIVAEVLLEKGYLAVHEGKTFHQYTDFWKDRPRYLLPIEHFAYRDISVSAQYFRLAFRDIAGGTDERTAIMALLPPGVASGDTAHVERVDGNTPNYLRLTILSIWSAYSLDWTLRQRVRAHVNMFIADGTPFPQTSRKMNLFLSHTALRLTCNHAGYAALWREQVGEVWREERAPFDWPVLAGDDARWAVRAAIDAVVAEAYGLSREQYAHVLSTFSHKSYPKAPELCLAAFDELKAIGLEAFTKKHDPYWDIPLNESLPEPVIELPIPQEAGGGTQEAGGQGKRRGRREATLREPAPRYAEPQLALDLGEPEPAQQVIDFAAAAARRAPGRKAAETPASYDAGEAGRYERLKALLAERGSLANGEVQFALAVDATTARALLKRLVDEGLARQEGERRGARYVKL